MSLNLNIFSVIGLCCFCKYNFNISSTESLFNRNNINIIFIKCNSSIFLKLFSYVNLKNIKSKSYFD